MKKVSAAYIILNVLIIFNLSEQIYGQEEKCITAGLGFAETLNIGIKFRVEDRSQLGVSIGTWPASGDWLFNWKYLISISGDYYLHFGGKPEYSDLRAWFFRTGIDYFRIGWEEMAENDLEIHFRFGRDFYISEFTGISIDAGIGSFLINETGFRSTLPVLGISLFYNF